MHTSYDSSMIFGWGGGYLKTEENWVQKYKLHDYCFLFLFTLAPNDSTGSAPNVDRTSRSTRHPDLPPRRAPLTKGERQQTRRRHAGINRMTGPNKRAFTRVTMEREKSRWATKRMCTNQSRFETTSISPFHTPFTTFVMK